MFFRVIFSESLFERVWSSSWSSFSSLWRRGFTGCRENSLNLQERTDELCWRRTEALLWDAMDEGVWLKKWKSAGDFYKNRFWQQNFKKLKLESGEKLSWNLTVSRTPGCMKRNRIYSVLPFGVLFPAVFAQFPEWCYF